MRKSWDPKVGKTVSKTEQAMISEPRGFRAQALDTLFSCVSSSVGREPLSVLG